MSKMPINVFTISSSNSNFPAITITPQRHHFAKPTKLQSETHVFALQYAAFCEPICWVLQANMQGFAKRSRFSGKPK